MPARRTKRSASSPSTPVRKTRSTTAAESPTRDSPGNNSKRKSQGDIQGTNSKTTPKRPRTVPSSSSIASENPDCLVEIFDTLVEQHGLETLLEVLQNQQGSEFTDAQLVLLAARKAFSNVRYEDVMTAFCMNINPADDVFRDWKDLEVPETLLPGSVIGDIANKIYEVYRTDEPPSELGNEAAKAAFLSAPVKALLNLFGGILTNKPERPMRGNDLNRVKVQIFCQGTILFFLREYKRNVHRNFPDTLAQVCCELYAVHQCNRRLNKDAAELDPSLLPPVRASLCDAQFTYFIGYDGKEFSKRIVPHARLPDTVDDYISTAIDMAQATFPILLEGYMNILELYRARSDHKSHDRPVRMTDTESHARKSSTEWGNALKLGRDAAAYFQHARNSRSKLAAETGLQKLYESLSTWPETSTDFKRSPGKLSLFLLPQTDAKTRQRVADYETMFANTADPNWVPPKGRPFRRFPEPARQKAVDEFWSMVPLSPDARESWSKANAGKDDFKVLSAFARNIDDEITQNAIHKILPPLTYSAALIETLKKSQQEKVWVL
ncbi:hypothetical protein MSAN_01355400 [Mycena sanguinolenta]|uniref:Uncharacterized protein n=1 Tax=Mycena sanguinolenta TaxID=230812 RepID=A0A8H6YGK9_9AGAR|nr:hypothetical protein MSAN_01355400 [Mycena sanguinolenta]